MYVQDFTKSCNIKEKHLKFQQAKVNIKNLQAAAAAEKHFSATAL